MASDQRHPPTTAGEMPRRGFLAAAGATLASGALASARTRDAGVARNVIFLVSDGMSTGTLTLADRRRRETDERASHWVSLWAKPGVRRAMQMTHSADSLVTDSAAAGSAWGSGVHVNNRAVNFTPDRREPTPILVEAKQRGKATGLVTTTRVTHATPASFVANVPSRDMESAIATQIVQRGVDVALGGGGAYFLPETIAMRPGLRVVRTRSELMAYAPGAGGDPRPVLGLFTDSHMRYELDRLAQPDAEREPSLAEMTRVALAELDRASDGFVLQIEGGRVDHAAHANDAPSLIADQLAFDDAIGVVERFTRDRDDSLVIVTTDHANANPGLTLYLDEGNRAWSSVASATHSFEWIFEQVASAGRDLDAIVGFVQKAMGVELTSAERQTLNRALLERQRVDPFRPAAATGPVLGSILANHFGVAFISPNHTADYVELTAFGPGSEPIDGLMDNIELHAIMRAAMGFKAASRRP